MSGDRESVYQINLGIIIYLDPDGLPEGGSERFKEIAAEHVIEFINHGIDRSEIELARFIDGVELIETRRI